MPTKYEVVRPFRLVDPRTGAGTHYQPGEPYTGPVDANPYLLDPGGPDGGGPLIADKQALEKQLLEQSEPAESATAKPAKEK